MAIGNSALLNNQTGNNNVAIGVNAGEGTSAQSKTGGVFIGYQAGQNEDNDNRLYIDNSNAASPLIYGEFDTDIARINGILQISDPSGTGYQFPTTDGTANQVLQTDGNGNITFATPTATDSWSLTGNAGTVNGTHFIGTTDIQDLDIRTNNVIRHRFTQQGQLEFLNTGNSVFIGEGAGANDDLSTNNNTFVGTSSGTANTTGFTNSFFGHDSGRDNTTGSSNSFFGENSGLLNTTGDGNSFFGQDSGANNTTGTRNSFFGQDSGFSNTLGVNNSFFGENTALNNTSGGNNSIYGQAGGFSNTTGDNNSFFGQASGFSNTTGNNNVAIGDDALNNNLTGNNNVAIGAEAGGGTTSQSKTGGVFIGYQAGQNEDNDNRLYIDNSNTSTPLIWGNFSSNIIGINRVATTNTLEVGGDASKSTAGDWLANSDVRLKKEITPLDAEATLHRLLALQGITYEWDDTVTGTPRPTGKHYGFTAQNIQEIFPTLVEEDAQGYLQTAYGTYDAMTVEAIRALNNRIKSLEKENEALRIQNTSANSRITAIEQWITQQQKTNEPLESGLGQEKELKKKGVKEYIYNR